MADSQNVDIVRATFEAYEAEDFDALAERMHPDVEMHEWPEGPDSRVYHGMDGILQAREEWAKAWEYIRAEPRRFVESGNQVFIHIRNIGKGRGSAIELDLDGFAVYTLRESKVAKVQFFMDREAALAAAGLTDEQIRQEAT
jgi:ketosteroid isomerase-like protein